jgi:hypothetical protein
MSRTNNTNADVNRCLSELASSTARSAVKDVATSIGQRPNVNDPLQSSLYQFLQPRLFAGLNESIARKKVSDVLDATLHGSRAETTSLPTGTGVSVQARGDIRTTEKRVETWSNGEIVFGQDGRPLFARVPGSLKPTTTVDASFTLAGGWSST